MYISVSVCERHLMAIQNAPLGIILTTEIHQDEPHVPTPNYLYTNIFPWCFKIRGKQILNE